MVTYDGYPEYDEIKLEGAPRGDCGRHKIPQSCIVSIYVKRAGRYMSAACPRCLVTDRDVEDLLACWHGDRWVEGPVWPTWRQIGRETWASGFDPDGVLWDDISRALRRPRFVVDPTAVAARWMYLANYPGQSVSDAIPMLERGERLVGARAFETSPEELRASIADSRARWESWCSTVWAELSEDSKRWIMELSSEKEPGDPFDQDWMYRWDRLPTSVFLDLRVANGAEMLKRPYESDWDVWSDGDDRSPRGVAQCLEQWAVDTGRAAERPSSGPALVERAVFGPNTEAVLAFLESVRNLDTVQLSCLRSALAVGWMHEPRPLVDARSVASTATFELELHNASMHLSQEVMIITDGPVPALLDRAEALLLEGLVDDAIVVELSTNWAEALTAAERIRAAERPDSGF